MGYGALRSVRTLEQRPARGSCDGLHHRRHGVHRRARGEACGRGPRAAARDLPRRGAARRASAALEVEASRRTCSTAAALRRAFRGCEIVFHAAGLVGSRPPERVWQVNALAPRIAVEAAAAEEVRRVVVTSSVAGIGPAPPDRPGTEEDVYARLGPRADLPRRQARGRVRGAGGGSAAGSRGGRGQPLVRLRRARRSLAAGRDLHPDDRQLPARAAPGGGGRRRPTSSTCATWPRATCSPPSAGGRASATCSAGTTPAGSSCWTRVGELSGVHHPLVVLPTRARPELPWLVGRRGDRA